jgi:hypothetical protein
MRWIMFVVAGVVLLVAVIAAFGATLPREHRASRTLRLPRPPADVWPELTRAAAASSVPVDVLESEPPTRLVTRVSASERQFGGTWTIAIAPEGPGSALTVTEDGWVANPIFRVISRYVIGHHATMDALLTSVAKALNAPAALSGS